MLEHAQDTLRICPEAGRERQRRTRLVAREVDLDPELERPKVDVPGPVDAEMVAAHLEQGFRGGPELVWAATPPIRRPRPPPPRSRATRGTSTGRRRRSRNALGVPGPCRCATVVESAACASRWRRSSRRSAGTSGISRSAWGAWRRPPLPAPSCSSCPNAPFPATCSTAQPRRCPSPRRNPARPRRR